jgi:predicted metal-dependent hydrolase
MRSISSLPLPGSPEITVHLRPLARGVRMSLRVSSTTRRVTLSLPGWVPVASARQFLEERQDWVRAALARTPAPRLVAPGDDVPFQGHMLRITEASVRAACIDADCLLVPHDPGGTRTAARVQAFLQARARAVLAETAAIHAKTLGRSISAITLRDTRSRWGSCTHDRRLMFNWRLIMAPPAVLDYVVAHEAAHLVEMNHSAAFWACVARLMPDYATHRMWLRAHGSDLMAYRFRPEA